MKKKSELPADDQLMDYLTTCSNKSLWALMEIVDTWFQLELSKIMKRYPGEDHLPKPKSDARKELSETLCSYIRYLGSNNIAYVCRRIFSATPGVSYIEIVRDVMALLNKQLDRKVEIPRVASLAEYEEIVCNQLIQIQFKGKSEDQIREILQEAGLDKEAIEKAAKALAKNGVAGCGLIYLVKLLGKKAVTEIIRNITVWLITKFVGKEAAEKVLAALLKKLPQKTVARAISGIGWALLVWDVFYLTAPASRKTVPCVAFVSAQRVLDRL